MIWLQSGIATGAFGILLTRLRPFLKHPTPSSMFLPLFCPCEASAALGFCFCISPVAEQGAIVTAGNGPYALLGMMFFCALMALSAALYVYRLEARSEL